MRKFTDQQIERARNYWRNLSDAELQEFHRHYTTGKGKGIYSGVDENTSFDDYLVLSAMQSAREIGLNS